jgi:hypothetical protein
MDELSIQLPPSRRRPWLWALATCAAVILSMMAFLWIDPLEHRVADNERVPKNGEELQDMAERVRDPDAFQTKATLKIADGGHLVFRYGPISDSGVQLRRLDPEGRTIWEQNCAPLGVGHSEYYHDVFAHIEGNTIKVISRGSYGTFVERLDLDSGKRIARSVRKENL